MSEPHRVVMPKLGQAMEYGVLSEWLVEDGAAVKPGQVVASVESDKANYEIEATVAGVLRHAVHVGDEVPVGDPLATIGEGSGAAAPTSGPQGAYAIPPEAPAAPVAAARATGAPSAVTGRVLASPKAKALAVKLNVDLTTVSPSRPDGLIVETDVEAAAAGGPIVGRVLASPKARALAASLDLDLSAVTAKRADGLIVALDVQAAAAARRAPAAEGAIPLSRLRRTGADRLARSWKQAPHIVQMIEVDATRIAKATGLMRRGGMPGTLNDLLIKVAADCLAKHPHLNVRFDGDNLIPLSGVDIGLAVATDDGLTVPVVRGADALPLDDIATQSRELIAAARAGRLTGRQVGAASLTISNLGAYGIAFGTPVLNLDEPVLIFVGAVEERAVVDAGQVVARAMTTLSIAYDHRVVDGLQAALFSRAIKQRLESLDGVLPADSAESPADLAERELEGRSRANGLAVEVRGAHHSWVVDEPVDVGGTDRGPDPVSYVLGGLMSCMIVAFKLAARRRKITVEEVRGSIAATPKGKVKAVTLALEVWCAADAADVEKLLASAKATCFVHDMLRHDLPIEIALKVHKPG